MCCGVQRVNSFTNLWMNILRNFQGGLITTGESELKLENKNKLMTPANVIAVSSSLDYITEEFISWCSRREEFYTHTWDVARVIENFLEEWVDEITR